ncbi:Crp/Fnr family transcriptional regulator [Lutibacter sp.]|uniref:Crp/Fnr family transcriptional regulator n=1 Tax=Lutibacter sp. TaxID=1925666 RepID=UPI001A20CD9B|nr:Crp/Fnr family transcriptional regulator [Lutibacter sp.]MBI9042564.1 Crp/Fnr family transcriptional regulator [Lutibacter sp.]
MSKLWYLENVNLFKILCPHKYGAYKDCHNFHNYNKLDYVYFEKDASNKVFLIDKGKVKIGYYTEEGKEIIKSILGKGELFGEKAILGEDKRNEFAQSIDNQTSICAIGIETLHELMRDNQTFTLKIYKFISFRIQKLERRLQLLLFKDTKTRLLDFLDELCEDYGVCCEETGKMKAEHPYTQKDIANLIGSSRPTLNLLMNELKEEGLIDFKGKHLFFLKKSA